MTGWWGCTCDGDVRCSANHQLDMLNAAGFMVKRERKPLHPVVDDLASERHEGWRDDNEQLRRDIRKAEDARDAALLAADKANEELAELRRQQPDDDAEVRRVQ